LLHKISTGCYKDTTITDIVDKNKMCDNKLMNKYFYILFAFLLSFMSCTARINGSLQANGQADLQIYAALEPRMTALIGSFAAASGTAQPGAPILNGAAMAASMSAAPGVESASFKNTSPAAIEGQVKIAKIGDFLAPGMVDGKQPGQGRGFITFEQSSSGGRCTVTISLETGPGILPLISTEMSEYLSALMAPLATDEVLTKTEYLFLVSSMYGRGIADEISKAAINASLEFPGPVQSVTGGTFSGRKAEFVIPLLDILVLETPLRYEITWK
jgi:hypothetical protein